MDKALARRIWPLAGGDRSGYVAAALGMPIGGYSSCQMDTTLRWRIQRLTGEYISYCIRKNSRPMGTDLIGGHSSLQQLLPDGDSSLQMGTGR